MNFIAIKQEGKNLERGLEASARRYAAENETALIELIETLCGIPPLPIRKRSVRSL